MKRLRNGRDPDGVRSRGAADRFQHLDITWLKDDGDTDPAGLPDPDTLIAEIVEELTAAAAELAEAMSPAPSLD